MHIQLSRLAVLNIAQSEGATGFKEYPDGDIMFTKPSANLPETRHCYIWAYKTVDGYSITGMGWIFSQNCQIGTLPLKEFT